MMLLFRRFAVSPVRPAPFPIRLFILGFLPFLFSSVILADDFEGTITGRVVARQSGKPIYEATVRAKAQITGKETQATTDEKGEFQLKGLRPGTYLLTISAEKYETLKLNTLPTVEAQKTTILRESIKLEPERAHSIIRGAVFDAKGFSLPGVKVVIESLSGDSQNVTGKVGEYVTNTAGEFAFRLPGITAVYRLTASMKGYQSRIQEVDVQKNEARNIAFTLEKLPTGEK